MGRRAMGAPVKARDGWRVRLRYGAGLRQRFRVPRMTEAQARERLARLERLAAKLSAAGKHAEAEDALTRAAAAPTDAELAEVERTVDELVAASPAPQREPRTFRDVAELWASGKLHRRYPDRVAAKDSRLDRTRLAVICQTVGDVPLARFTVDTAERALAALPRALMRSTRRAYAQLISRVLRLAAFPLRVIEHPPLPPRWLPGAGPRRAFAFLYPDEEARLLRCDEIPLVRRLLYGFLAREGCRISEALRLTWSDLDLERGVIRLDRNKTKRPRSWVLGADVLRALQCWSRMSQGTTVFDAGGLDASVFRADLELARVRRPELYERTRERNPIRLHDLRATFITLALADGRTETWVMDRTGHTTSQMLGQYRRQARHAAELELGWLGPLDELSRVGQDRGKGAKRPKKLRGQSNNRPPEPHDQAEITPSAPPPGGHGPAGFERLGQDPVELALAESLRAATAAGEWAVVFELARELEARRLELTTASPAPPGAKPKRQR